jgi:hypothetical protein
LLPPALTDWVPDDHVVWSILGAVDQMELGASMPRTAGTAKAVPPTNRR